MTVKTMMALGTPAEVAKAIAGGTKSSGLTATGTVIGDALDLTADTNLVTTTAANTGVQLPDELGVKIVANGGANALKIYPHSATGKINNAADGAAYSIAAGKAAMFVRVDVTNWVCVAV